MNPQSRAGTMAVMAVLIITGVILAVTYSRDADRISDDFHAACHNVAEVPVPHNCPDVFRSVPLCDLEDCSDQHARAGYWTNRRTGLMYYVVPDYPTREASQEVNDHG